MMVRSISADCRWLGDTITIKAGASKIATHKASNAVTVDLPLCLEQSNSARREVDRNSSACQASGVIPQSFAKMTGSARASVSARVPARLRGAVSLRGGDMVTPDRRQMVDCLRGRGRLCVLFVKLAQCQHHRA